MNMKLEKYCKSKMLDCHIEDDTLRLTYEDRDWLFGILEESQKLFNEDMEFLISQDQEGLLDGWVYSFGGRWYVQSKGVDKVEFKELIYIGKASQKIPTNSFLGIHSGFELMNGIGLYKDWIKKAKFLGVESLGICEKGTLAGALSFQKECNQNNVKSIIGMTVPTRGILEFDVKLYVKNFQGWLNLLKINYKLNVDGDSTIDTGFLKECLDGLYLIADPKTMNIEDATKIIELIDFYQLDTVNFLNEDVDSDYINNLEKFMLSDIEPISIVDAYYLEKEDYLTREVLWTINKAFDSRTNNQYFKSSDEYAKELIQMFESSDKGWVSLFKQAKSNEKFLSDTCNFKYDTDTRHLPKYKMTEEESSMFNTNEELFLHIIKKGFKDRNIKEPSKYIDRLKKEISVLKMGDVVDYFLSLYDIIKYAKSQKMLTGIGRGSAGGSLVAYLMGIIQVDPLRFDLLFERFLNSGRMGKFEDRPNYEIDTDEGVLTFEEGSLVRISRDKKEMVVFIHEVKEEDNIIRY